MAMNKATRNQHLGAATAIRTAHRTAPYRIPGHAFQRNVSSTATQALMPQAPQIPLQQEQQNLPAQSNLSVTETKMQVKSLLEELSALKNDNPQHSSAEDTALIKKLKTLSNTDDVAAFERTVYESLKNRHCINWLDMNFRGAIEDHFGRSTQYMLPVLLLTKLDYLSTKTKALKELLFEPKKVLKEYLDHYRETGNLEPKPLDCKRRDTLTLAHAYTLILQALLEEQRQQSQYVRIVMPDKFYARTLQWKGEDDDYKSHTLMETEIQQVSQALTQLNKVFEQLLSLPAYEALSPDDKTEVRRQNGSYEPDPEKPNAETLFKVGQIETQLEQLSDDFQKVIRREGTVVKKEEAFVLLLENYLNTYSRFSANALLDTLPTIKNQPPTGTVHNMDS